MLILFGLAYHNKNSIEMNCSRTEFYDFQLMFYGSFATCSYPVQLTTKSFIRSQAHRFFGISGAEYYSLGKKSSQPCRIKAAFHNIFYLNIFVKHQLVVQLLTLYNFYAIPFTSNIMVYVTNEVYLKYANHYLHV